MTNQEARSYIAGAVHALYLALPSLRHDGNPSGVHVTLYVIVDGLHEVSGVELCLSLPEIGPGQRMAQTVLFANESNMPMASADAIGYLIEVLDIAG